MSEVRQVYWMAAFQNCTKVFGTYELGYRDCGKIHAVILLQSSAASQGPQCRPPPVQHRSKCFVFLSRKTLILISYHVEII
jgi:hypothetical protein